ncbi:MAG: hypothetical protein WKF84_17365 [Pyrinomonadaceae bacterium]
MLGNVAIRVENTESPEQFKVSGRGELQLAILIEMMRREGYELQVSKPRGHHSRDEDGTLLEPIEQVVDRLPGGIHRRGNGSDGSPQRPDDEDDQPRHAAACAWSLKRPSRGLIGFRGEFLTETKGTGLLNTLFLRFGPNGRAICAVRSTGSLVADRDGRDNHLRALQFAGARHVSSFVRSVKVYEGMVIGENARAVDLDVNAIKEKKLTNMRAASADEAMRLVPVKELSLEQALEFIADDELVEVTPASIRLRKRALRANERPKKK